MEEKNAREHPPVRHAARSVRRFPQKQTPPGESDAIRKPQKTAANTQESVKIPVLPDKTEAAVPFGPSAEPDNRTDAKPTEDTSIAFSFSDSDYDSITAAAERKKAEAIKAPFVQDLSSEPEKESKESRKSSEKPTKKRHTALYAAAACLLLSVCMSSALLFLQTGKSNAVLLTIEDETIGYLSSAKDAEDAVSMLIQEDAALEPLLSGALTCTEDRVHADIPYMSGEEIKNSLLGHVHESYTEGFLLTVGDKKEAAYASDEATILTSLRTAEAMRENTLADGLPENGILERTSAVTWEAGWIPKKERADEGALVAAFCDPVSDAYLSYDVVCLDEETVVLAYDTDFIAPDEQFDGVSTLISEGRNGLIRITTERRFDPDTGEERAAQEISREVLREPVNASAYAGVYPLTDESVCTNTFIWPLPVLPDKEPPEGTDPETLNPFSLKQTYISSMYGERSLWGKYDFHLGYDIVVPYGTEIAACDGGVVVFAAYTSSYGYVVRIRHADGVETVYAHQKKMLVKAGDIVKQGQCIGYVGTTGVTSGSHLHLEFRKDHVTCDPAAYISIPEEIYILQ